MWQRRYRRRSEERRTVQDAELLLSGRSMTGVAYGVGRIPVWTMVNALAHCDLDHLMAIRALRGSARPGGKAAVSAFLAAELLVLAPSEDQLVCIQREVLVPLELELLAGTAPPAGTTPAQVAALVLDALARRPAPRDQ